MGQPRRPPPELLVVACFSRHAAAHDWIVDRLRSCFGPIAFSSKRYRFDQTRYYEATMGSDLTKVLHAFTQLVAPEQLAEIKQVTNALEDDLARSGRYPEARPINLDPGLLSLGKFVLATTKDQAHRVYLKGGIFAEVTLRFCDGTFTPWPWTYADYRLPEVIAFLNQARTMYARQLKQCP